MIPKIRNIVVGVDMTRGGDPVLGPAAELARHTGAALHVVHGYMLSDPLLDAYARAGYLGEQTLTQFGENIQAALEAQVAEVLPYGVASVRAVAGSPATAMLELADEVSADLIVVGSTRHDRLPLSLLGSSCRAVIRRSELPVLVMRPDIPGVPRRILVATDLSPLARAAYEEALAIAGDSAAVEMRCVLVISDALLMLPLEQRLLDRVAEEELEEFTRGLTIGGRHIERVVRRGDPATEIAAEARDWSADMIALGSHGRHGMERFLIGSVAESTLKNAPCNVLVVPPGAPIVKEEQAVARVEEGIARKEQGDDPPGEHKEHPTFRNLTRDEANAVLSRNNVGRIAYAKGNQVEIIPVHYVHRGDWIYGRTTPGGRIERTADPWWPVAFQVDEIDGLFDWRSVVVKGGLYLVPKDGAAWEREAWADGVEALRSLLPEALADDDPVPERSAVFRIAVQEVTGRQASTRPT